jgi:hypothetical protein
MVIMQSENSILHFLRTFPIWMITLPLYVFNEILYLYYQDVFLKDMTRDAWNALLVSIGIRIAQPPQQQQNTEQGDNITNVINPPPEILNQTDLQKITPTDIENAVEGLEENK